MIPAHYYYKQFSPRKKKNKNPQNTPTSTNIAPKPKFANLIPRLGDSMERRNGLAK